MLNNSPEREDRLPPFFFAFFPPVSLSSSFGRKEEKEKVEKKSAAKSLKRILSRARERCRDYIATERVLCLAIEVKPHRYQHPLFLWQLKAQRKSLAKRNAAKPL